jgi:hypothetical protein
VNNAGILVPACEVDVGTLCTNSDLVNDEYAARARSPLPDRLGEPHFARVSLAPEWENVRADRGKVDHLPHYGFILRTRELCVERRSRELRLAAKPGEVSTRGRSPRSSPRAGEPRTWRRRTVDAYSRAARQPAVPPPLREAPAQVELANAVKSDQRAGVRNNEPALRHYGSRWGRPERGHRVRMPDIIGAPINLRARTLRRPPPPPIFTTNYFSPAATCRGAKRRSTERRGTRAALTLRPSGDYRAQPGTTLRVSGWRLRASAATTSVLTGLPRSCHCFRRRFDGAAVVAMCRGAERLPRFNGR